MPEHYEREIEDILRNIKDYRPKPSLRERLHLPRRRPARQPARLRPRSTLPARHRMASISERCLLGSLLVGLVAAGIAYSRGGGDALTGALAVLALFGLLLGIFTYWRAG